MDPRVSDYTAVSQRGGEFLQQVAMRLDSTNKHDPIQYPVVSEAEQPTDLLSAWGCEPSDVHDDGGLSLFQAETQNAALRVIYDLVEACREKQQEPVEQYESAKKKPRRSYEQHSIDHTGSTARKTPTLQELEILSQVLIAHSLEVLVPLYESSSTTPSQELALSLQKCLIAPSLSSLRRGASASAHDYVWYHRFLDLAMTEPDKATSPDVKTHLAQALFQWPVQLLGPLLQKRNELFASAFCQDRAALHESLGIGENFGGLTPEQKKSLQELSRLSGNKRARVNHNDMTANLGESHPTSDAQHSPTTICPQTWQVALIYACSQLAYDAVTKDPENALMVYSRTISDTEDSLLAYSRSTSDTPDSSLDWNYLTMELVSVFTCEVMERLARSSHVHLLLASLYREQRSTSGEASAPSPLSFYLSSTKPGVQQHRVAPISPELMEATALTLSDQTIVFCQEDVVRATQSFFLLDLWLQQQVDQARDQQNGGSVLELDYVVKRLKENK
jgi:hypothetical protein